MSEYNPWRSLAHSPSHIHIARMIIVSFHASTFDKTVSLYHAPPAILICCILVAVISGSCDCSKLDHISQCVE